MDSIKKKLKKRKKILTISTIVIFVMIFFVFNSDYIFGRINEYYDTNVVNGTISIDKTTKKNIFLETIAWLVYVVANFVEWMGSFLIGKLTGKEMFPWADKIIFNTIPFLDINFINPEPGSIFKASGSSAGEFTFIGNIIRNLYFTTFLLSIAALTITVGIMGIKLAVSSIAGEKAKYKKALMDWALAVILVFTIHYFISFAFFMNEKIVEVASSVLLNVSNGYSSSTGEQIKTYFTDMSTYFYDILENGKNFDYIVALLYTIFVVQSFMFFTSYIKRMFYVITLALFAPFIIIYDFIMKIIK